MLRDIKVMEPRVSIRPADVDDAARLAGIYNWHVRNGTATFETEPPDAAEIAQRISTVQSKQLPWLVAVTEGRIAGYAYAGTYRPRPAYRFTVENSIYLHPELTGKGIGSLLMAPLLEACAERGCRQMIAVIGDSANAASIRLHEKFGFRHVGVFRDVGFKFDRWLDTVLMQRAL